MTTNFVELEESSNFSKTFFLVFDATTSFVHRLFHDRWKKYVNPGGWSSVEFEKVKDIPFPQYTKIRFDTGTVESWDVYILSKVVPYMYNDILKNRVFSPLEQKQKQDDCEGIEEFYKVCRCEVSHLLKPTLTESELNVIIEKFKSAMPKLGMSATEVDQLFKRATGSVLHLGEAAFKAKEYEKAAEHFGQELEEPYITEQKGKIIREWRSICYINLVGQEKDLNRKKNLWVKATTEFEDFADINNEAWTKKPSYFVERKIYSNHLVSEKIFGGQTTEKFAFTGFHDEAEFRNFAQRQLLGLDVPENFKLEIGSNFLFLDDNADWNTFTQGTEGKVHLIYYDRNLEKLGFRGSTGSIENIRPFLNAEKEHFETEEFVKFVSEKEMLCDNRVLCIAVFPGMGKTFLFREICRFLKKTFPFRFVMLLDFPAILREIKMNNKPDFAAKVIDEITKYIYREDQGRQLLVSEFKNSREIRFELLLDGFDKLLLHDIEFALSCLYELKEKYSNSTRIWVASRQQYLSRIENKLQILGYRIDPFTEKDQINFLAKFWLNENPEGDLQHYEEFAKKCLSAIKPQLNNNNHSRNFAEIPLQCLLIAEVFMKFAPGFPDSQSYDFENVGSISIMSLYESLIENKIKKSLGTNDLQAYSDKIQKLRRIHIHLAINTLFPGEITLLNDNPHITEHDLEEVLKVGILQSTRSATKSLHFIHRTFAEYFVACFLAERLNCPKKSSTLDNLLRGVLQTYLSAEYIPGYSNQWGIPETPIWKFSQSTICFFLDCLVNNLEKNEHFVSENENKMILLEHKTAQACIFHNFPNLLQMKAIYFETIPGVGKPRVRFPLLAVTFSSVEVLKWMFTGMNGTEIPLLNTATYNDNFSVDRIGCPTILHIAVYQGRYRMVQYLLENHGFKDEIQKIIPDKPNTMLSLLFLCLMDTDSCSLDEISDRINILKKLVGLNRSLLESTHYKTETPLLSRGVHHLLLTEMLRVGADPLVINRSGRTFVRLAARFLTPERFQNLLESNAISNEHLVKTRDPNSHGATLLHTLVEENCPSFKTLQILSNHGADFNALNAKERSVLDQAVISLWERISSDEETKKWRELCLNLIKFSANPSNPQKSVSKFSVLHMAILLHYFKILPFLIDDMKCNVNAEDADGRTPLDLLLVLPNNPEGTYEAAKCLYKYMPNQIINEGQLLLAIKNLNTDAARFIIDSGSYQIDFSNKFQLHHNNTLLHLTCQNGLAVRNSLELLKVVLEKGSDINATNDYQETPLECLLRRENDHTRVTLEILRNLHPTQTMSESPKLTQLIFVWLQTNHNFLIQNNEIGDALDFLVSKHHIMDEENGNTLLHMAATWSKHEGVAHLLDSQVMKVNDRNKDRQTPLYLSLFETKNTSLETVDLLLKRGSTFQALNEKFKSLPIQLFKLSPRQSFPEQFEILKIFLRNHCNLRDIDDDGNFVFNYVFTPRMEISPGQFHEVVLLMNENNCLDLLSHPQKTDGVTPLHTIVKFVEIEIATLEILKSSQQVNFNAVTNTGRSVLCYAVEGHRSEAFLNKVCREGFCDWKKSENETTEKCNIIHYAASYGSAEALKFFLDMDKTENLEMRYAKNIYGHDAMHFATKRKLESEWEKEEKRKVCRLLADEGITF